MSEEENTNLNHRKRTCWEGSNLMVPSPKEIRLMPKVTWGYWVYARTKKQRGKANQSSNLEQNFHNITQNADNLIFM